MESDYTTAHSLEESDFFSHSNTADDNHSIKVLVKSHSKPPMKTGKQFTDFAQGFAYSLGLDPEILSD